ncbi:MAG: hypothetical protein ACP5OX_01560 [Minisyncoccia bacterium]
MLKIFQVIFLNLNYFYVGFDLVLIIFRYLKKETLSINRLKKIIFFLVIFILIINILKTLINYFLWLNNSLSQKLLPPYIPFIYFLRYSFQHYFFSAMVTIIFAYLIFWLILKFNKKFKETFFYDEEPYFASLGFLLTGWPSCLFYLCLVLFLGIIFHLIFIVFNLLDKRTKRRSVKQIEENISQAPFRLSLLNFWLPSALLVLILNDIISKWQIFQYFKI